ncbi:DUF2510 domain-containing protein [Humibacillus xanthopallidus]|uniref:Uncharacterized protein DUF2510 n=1 Tax=Humibacillus xanthopallidus TaxID=412689 RepID=A0A543I3B5_9MICO|nr:DUF2510 domain-containing protein [Humibacillus xanthopallidus]TQM65057.1 uncharacterized protein DUF2510 [Humibacillus xanthopallidus]
MITRRGWVWILGLLGAASIAWGFRLQSNANFDNAVRGYLGVRERGTAAPWVFGILGAVLLVIALGIVIAGSRQQVTTTIPMGWHDHPDDPTKLRYHDGNSWTNRTADKTAQ